MRKILLPVLIFCSCFLVSCLETTQEVTINADGSGTITNTTDMSPAMGMLKTMGSGAEAEELAKLNIDSSFNMKQGADSIAGLTEEEKKMMIAGTFNIKANAKEEIFIMHISFPFQSLSQVDAYNKLSNKVISGVMKEMPGIGDGDDETLNTDPPAKEGSIDDYYTTEYKNGEITRKLKKEKYAVVGSDESIKSLKEGAEMGVAMKANYVFNLPRPAKTVEGKNAKLSADKKKVTISANMEDFFEDGEAFEFRIKY